MRVLILSCNTGGGHNSCADAIREAFMKKGHHCDAADAIQFVSDKLSRLLYWGHVTLYRYVPRLVRVGYGFAEKHPAVLREDACIYKLLTGGTEPLYGYILKGKYDAVVCTHVFSGLLLRQTMKEHPLQLKTAFVATDYTCSPGTANSELDYYFIPAESLTEEFVAQNVPKEKVFPSGIPVRKEFYEQINKQKAKEMLKIDPSHVHLLMMCGSMGCGPLEKLAKRLSECMDQTMELSIVCGTNEKLYQKLTEEFGGSSQIHIRGFVKDVGLLMDSADLYLTKPGGLSTTEAAAKRLPMVLIDAVAGCEEYNRNYFVRLGGAVTADSPEELLQLCLELMRNKKYLGKMKAALEKLPHQNAANCICEVMCNEGIAGSI